MVVVVVDNDDGVLNLVFNTNMFADDDDDDDEKRSTSVYGEANNDMASANDDTSDNDDLSFELKLVEDFSE